MLEDLLKIHIPEATSESKASRECRLKKPPGDSDAQLDLGDQLAAVPVGSEPWLLHVENGNSFSITFLYGIVRVK